jgi:ABC-type transport system substrate-binding protein
LIGRLQVIFCFHYCRSWRFHYLSGLGWPYQQWPQDLKDEYAYNPTKAKQLLAAAGFPNGFNTDLVAASDSDLDLAQIVKSYFAVIGINMEIRVMDAASWTSFVYTGRKQDALAQRSIGALGQTSGPLNQLPRSLGHDYFQDICFSTR